MFDQQEDMRRQKFTLKTDDKGDIPPVDLEVRLVRKRQGKTKRLTFDQVTITTDPPAAFEFERKTDIDTSGGILHYKVTPSKQLLDALGSHLEFGVTGEVRSQCSRMVRLRIVAGTIHNLSRIRS